MKRIYIVQGEVGLSHEEYSNWDICAFQSRDDAFAERHRLEEEADECYAKLERIRESYGDRANGSDAASLAAWSEMNNKQQHTAKRYGWIDTERPRYSVHSVPFLAVKKARPREEENA